MGLFDLFKSKKPEPSADAMGAVAKVALVAFPGGPKQINEESAQLHALLRGRLNKHEARELLTKTKALLVIAKDKSEARILPSIESRAAGKLTQHEARLVYQFLTGISGSLHAGGDGSSRQAAVVVNSTSSVAGIDAEYKWLEARFGKQDKDWKVTMRFHGDADGKSYEAFVVQLATGAEQTIHFDISSFYGRS